MDQRPVVGTLFIDEIRRHIELLAVLLDGLVAAGAPSHGDLAVAIDGLISDLIRLQAIANKLRVPRTEP